jgi:predicted nucleic acid-binding Zn ribbon protein
VSANLKRTVVSAGAVTDGSGSPHAASVSAKLKRTVVSAGAVTDGSGSPHAASVVASGA